MSAPRNYPRPLLGLALTLVVLMCGASLALRLGRVEAAAAHPQTIHSSAAGNLITARTGHEATLLPNGKVLVAGGYGATVGAQVTDALSSAELYDPANGTWSSTGSLNEPRTESTATLLENGKVLVVGGGVQYGTSSAELYDPAIGTWSPTGSLDVARSYHAATLLSKWQGAGRGRLCGGNIRRTVRPSQWDLEPDR